MMRMTFIRVVIYIFLSEVCISTQTYMVRSDGLQVYRFQPTPPIHYPIGGADVGYVQEAHSITVSKKE